MMHLYVQCTPTMCSFPFSFGVIKLCKTCTFCLFDVYIMLSACLQETIVTFFLHRTLHVCRKISIQFDFLKDILQSVTDCCNKLSQNSIYIANEYWKVDLNKRKACELQQIIFSTSFWNMKSIYYQFYFYLQILLLAILQNNFYHKLLPFQVEFPCSNIFAWFCYKFLSLIIIICDLFISYYFMFLLIIVIQWLIKKNVLCAINKYPLNRNLNALYQYPENHRKSSLHFALIVMCSFNGINSN